MLRTSLNGNLSQVRRLRQRAEQVGARADREARIGLRKGAEAIRDATARHAPESFAPYLSVRVEGHGNTLRATVEMDTHAKPHAALLNRGTGVYGPFGQGYFIRPRVRQALRWFNGGAAVFRRIVFQLGLKPWHFMEKGFAEGVAQARRFLSARLGNLTRGERRGD